MAADMESSYAAIHTGAAWLCQGYNRHSLVWNEPFQRVAPTLGQKLFSPTLPPLAFASPAAIQPATRPSYYDF
jgi:hypothetical protein